MNSNSRPPRFQHCHRLVLARGFTLIELITTIVILGVLAVAIVPKLADRKTFDERGYFDELIQATRYAQKLAIASGCEVRISINANDFSLRQPANAAECGSGSINWNTVVALPGKQPPYNAPAGVSVTAGTGNIIFSAAGLTTANQTVTINGVLSLQVHGATGYVERL